MSLDVLVRHQAAREALLTAFHLPVPLAAPMIKYLGLFRTGKAALSFDKVAKVVGELLPMIQAASITRNRQIYTAPIEYWATGLNNVMLVEGLTLPLKGNGLLLKIVCDLSERGAARGEQSQDMQRAGRTAVGTVAAHQPAVVPPPRAEASKQMPDSVRAALQKKPP